MKKSIFIIVALCAATFAKAEITLEYTESNPNCYLYTIPQMLYGINGYSGGTSDAFRDYKNYLQTIFPQCPFYVKYKFDESGEKADFVFTNALDYSEYKTIEHAENGAFFNNAKVKTFLVTYDIFAVDKLAFFVLQGDDSSNYQWQIIDEDGNILLDIPSPWEAPMFQKVGSTWKLVYPVPDDGVSRVYVFPGDGSMPNSSQAISNPISKRNAKKIVREGQILVETENNTFDLRGQEVR